MCVCVCVYSRSNRPDAPRGDERASVAVSQRRYYFTLHEERMKRQEEGELVTHSAFRGMETTTMLYISGAPEHRNRHSMWSYVSPVSHLVSHCEESWTYLGNVSHRIKEVGLV